MKFKPEWVDAELEVNSDRNEAVNGRSCSGNAAEDTEKLQELKTSDDSVATITPTQAD